jgi:hypothetical protein
MEKGHFGHYTGNARHSRKEEMIHDRELIYDAKKQLHHADQDYKSDSPAQMNADLAYDPVNDRADSSATNKDKRHNNKLDRIQGRLDKGMKSKRQAERNLNRLEKITNEANRAGNFETYNRATTAADQAVDQYANFGGSPAKNSGLGPKEAGSGAYMTSPANNVGCKYTKRK